MPTKRRRSLRRAKRLTPDQRWFLGSGVDLDCSTCPMEQNHDLARQLWERHGRELMAEARRKGWAGWRPWAWWMFEHGGRPEGLPRVQERAYLAERDLLEPWELSVLRKEAKRDSQDTEE